MSANRSGGAGTTAGSTGGGGGTTATQGTGTSSTSSAGTTGGSASGGSVAGAPGSQVGDVSSNSPADAAPNQPHSGTPAFAKPGEGTLNLGAPGATGGTGQTPASAGYPLRVLVDGHTHAGQPVKKGQTIALDAAEYRWAVTNKIGEAGNADEVGLDVDEAGNAIKPAAPVEIELPAPIGGTTNTGEGTSQQ